MPRARARPFVSLNAAATVDGKLAPSTRDFIPFGSPRDQQLLFELRTRADAVMSGARTVDLGPVDLGPGPLKYRRMRLRQGLSEFNLRVVVSGSASLNPHAEIFRHRFSPIIVLVSASASAARQARLRQVADEVKVCGAKEVDLIEALHWLRQRWGVKRLLCEGGGALNGALFEAGVVDEVHLTVVPLIFGGRDAPTLADGRGVLHVHQATQLHLHSCQRAGSELFLTYRVRRSGRRRSLRPETQSETP